MVYEARWASTRYQTKKHIHYISHEKASQGVVLCARAVGVDIGPNAWQVLCHTYHEAHEINDIWDAFEETDEVVLKEQKSFQRTKLKWRKLLRWSFTQT